MTDFEKEINFHLEELRLTESSWVDDEGIEYPTDKEFYELKEEEETEKDSTE